MNTCICGHNKFYELPDTINFPEQKHCACVQCKYIWRMNLYESLTPSARCFGPEEKMFWKSYNHLSEWEFHKVLKPSTTADRMQLNHDRLWELSCDCGCIEFWQAGLHPRRLLNKHVQCVQCGKWFSYRGTQIGLILTKNKSIVPRQNLVLGILFGRRPRESLLDSMVH